MAYFNIRTPKEFDREMERHNAVMREGYMQTAFNLLCQAAESEYETPNGAGDIVNDVVDTAIMSRRAYWRRDYRAKLYRRTVRRPKTRAALNAFLSIHISAANEKFNWKNEEKDNE